MKISELGNEPAIERLENLKSIALNIRQQVRDYFNKTIT